MHIPTHFRDLPIRGKLLAIIALAAALGLLLNLALFTAGDLRSKRAAMSAQLQGLAEIVAATSAAAVRFDDADAALTTLSALSARPEIVSATITRPDGRLFARYPSGVAAASDPSRGGLVLLHHPLRHEGELLGEVTLEADLQGAWRETLASLWVASLTSLAAFAVAMAMAVRLQRSISQPLQALAAVAQAVAADGDHGRRVDLPQRDEIGELAGRFNAMLAELQARENDLQEHRGRLEQQVQQRTAQLSQAKDQAEAASVAKSRFLANMSHELRTPLNAVIGAAQLLRAEQANAERREVLTDAIQRGGTNLLGLIENVLDLSRIEAGELALHEADFHLVECIEGALSSATLSAHAKGLQLACIIDPRLPAWRHGDAARLRQVVLNLLGNAVKFTERGEITVRVRQGAAAHAVHFSVTDTGVGIGAKSLPHIFEPFRQAEEGADRRFGGTGLGLAIVRQLVEALGGQVTVTSQLGAGACFAFELPLRGADQPPAEPAPLWHRVIYFEPHEPSAQALAAHLQRLGCRARRCESAAQLRGWLGDERALPAPWLLLAVDAPETAGLLDQLADVIEPDRVIALSNDVSYDVDRACDGLHLSRQIVKPVTRAALVSRMRVASPAPAAAAAPVAEALLSVAQLDALTHVLVVEDDELNRFIVSGMLRHAGYRVSTAVNGRQALQQLRESDRVDLVLMDWQMPDMDGLEVTRSMRAGAAGPTGPSVPIVALTANAFAEDRATCLAAGMNDFLTKPVLATSLLATVARWTRRRAGEPAAGPTPIAQPEPGLASAAALVFDPSVLAALPMVADGSSPEYGGELCAMFLQAGAATLREVELATAANDAKRLRLAVHSLKSTSASIGALELAALAEQHETRLRFGLPLAEALPQLLAEAYTRLEAAMRAVHPVATSAPAEPAV